MIGKLISFFSISLLSGALIYSQTINQECHGFCCVNVVNQGHGTVIVICEGVPPEVFADVTKELERMKIDRLEALHLADERARQYHAIQSELDVFKGSPSLVKSAKLLLSKGQLKKAEGIVDQLLAKTQALGDLAFKQLAIANFIKAGLLDLQGAEGKALEYLERAYSYDSHNAEFAIVYSTHLSDQGRDAKAEVVLHSITDEEMSRSSATTQTDIFVARESLAMLYLTQRRYEQALLVAQRLVQSLPSEGYPEETPFKELDPVLLYSLEANCFLALGQTDKATSAINDAESMLNRISSSALDKNTVTGQAFLDIAEYYRKVPGAEKKAEEYYIRALTKLQEKPTVFRSTSAYTLAVGMLSYADFLRISEGEAASRPRFDQAITLARELYQKEPQYAEILLRCVNSKARSYLSTAEYDKAIELIENDPVVFIRMAPLASSLLLKQLADAESLLGQAYYKKADLQSARNRYALSVQYWVRLRESGAEDSLSTLVRLYMIQAAVCQQLDDLVCAEESLNARVAEARSLAKSDPSSIDKLLGSLIQRGKFFLDRKKYGLAKDDAVECERAAVSLMAAGTPVKRTLVMALDLELAIEQASGNGAVCSIATRGLQQAETEEQRRIFLSALDKCGETN
jgi:hypothetical protein